jgi:site-specific DNA recombinase
MQPLTDAGRQSNDRTVRSQRCDYLLRETVGGCFFGRGALYHLLRNRIYRGEFVHRGTAYPGKQNAIVDEGT